MERPSSDAPTVTDASAEEPEEAIAVSEGAAAEEAPVGEEAPAEEAGVEQAPPREEEGQPVPPATAHYA